MKRHTPHLKYEPDSMTVYPTDDMRIAATVHETGIKGEAHANGHLFAGAPEAYSELKTIETALNAHSRLVILAESPLHKRILKAIAKMEGRDA